MNEEITHDIARPLKDPVVSKSLFDCYSGTPLPKELGIKANSVVVLIGAPEGFEETLGKLTGNLDCPCGRRLEANVPANYETMVRLVQDYGG